MCSYGWSSTEAMGISPLVHSYLGKRDAIAVSPEDITEISKLLAAAKPPTLDRFQDVVSDYMVERVEGFAQSLEFLVSGHPNGLSETEIIEHIQLHDLIFGEDSASSAEVAQFTSPADILTLMRRLKIEGKVMFRKSPVENWRRRATSLKTEKMRNTRCPM